MEDANLHQGHRKRMIERFLRDPDGVSDHELLELILYSAIPRKDVNEIAHKILRACGSLANVLKADKQLLLSIDGVGPAVVCQINILNQLVERMKYVKPEKQKFTLHGMKNQLIQRFQNEDKEKFLLYLLGKGEYIKGVLEYESLSYEKIDIDVHELAKTIALVKPESAILVHNHPSGDETPSYADDLTTKKIAIMLKVHAVNLFDHIIISGDKYFSYHFSDRLNKLLENINKEL